MIFYFTSTGNCKYVAEKTALSTGDKICSVTDCVKNGQFSFSIADNENLGFVLPTYAWALPSVVMDFLKKAVFHYSVKPYVFFIGTYGSFVGNPHYYINRYLKDSGLELNACFDVKMPDNWTVFFDLSDKDKVNSINKKAEHLIDSAVEKICSHTDGNYMKDSVPFFAASLIYNLGYDSMRKTKHLRADDNCIGCGLCAKICPVGAIEMRGSKPHWIKEQCTMCLGCLHRCPKFAIQYDNKTKNHGQYRNPNTTL